MYRQPHGTWKQFQMIPHRVCWDSARAEGQTLTIINDVPMELYRLPPANGAQYSNRRWRWIAPLAFFFFFFPPPWCVTVYPCAHACGLTWRTCQNLIVGNELRWGGKKKQNKLSTAMLALTYHKRNANMSKHSGNTFSSSTKNSKQSRYGERNSGLLTAGNRARDKCVFVCVCVCRGGGRKETLHKHSLMWECAPLQGPLLYVNLLCV